MRRLIDPAKAAAVEAIEDKRREEEKASSLRGSIEPPKGGVTLDDLIDKSLTILFRETVRLLEESAAGKLSRDSAICVRDNLKLLKDLKEKEKEILDGLTEEQLEALAEKED